MKNLQPLSNRLQAASGSSLAQVKTQQLAREEEEKRRMRRVKGAVILAEQFLLDQGYVNALQTLQQESGLTLGTMCVADNIDLLTILGEFEEYYEWKYQRKPKLFRMRSGQDEEPVKVVTEGGERLLVRKNKAAGSAGAGGAAAAAAAASSGAPGAYGYGTGEVTGAAGSSNHNNNGNEGKLAALKPAGGVSRTLNKAKESHSKKQQKEGGGDGLELNLEGQKMQLADGGEWPGLAGGGDDEEQNSFYGKALRPLPVFATAELAELAANIMRDILVTDPAVRWKDIAELENAKQLLKEAVVMPVKYPELFEGMVRPWKGILLFGPPGTGKTLLAKAVATECRTTFFNISASSVVSKWRGDSEKLIRMLFDLAVHYAPSTIFIDEIDSIMSARSSEGEHEGSRRMKTELLTQMDGLSKRQGGDVVFVLAASNVPWDLDTAMLRRLEKRILVTLPTAHARELIFRQLLWSKVWEPDQFDWAACAADTADMSAADVDIVCREAMMRPVRKMIEKLEGFHKGQMNVQQARQELERLKLSQESRVSLADVEASIRCTKTSVRKEDLEKYDTWTAQYGSGMST